LGWPSRYGRLDLLINNAGVMGTPRQLNPRMAFELQFRCPNHLGHFASATPVAALAERPRSPGGSRSPQGAQFFRPLPFDDLNGESH